MKIHQPHDALFKAAFQKKEVCIDFLKANFPKLAKKVNLQTLKLASTESVGSNLEKNYCDILYTAKEKGKDILIYFLLECQMTKDPFIIARIYEYITSAQLKHFRAYGKFPTIYPILITPFPWKKGNTLASYFENFDEHVHALEYDFGHQPSKELKLQDGQASVFEFLIGNYKKKEFCKFAGEDPRVKELIASSSYQQEALIWITHKDKHSPEEILDELGIYDKLTKENLMSYLQQQNELFLRRGIQKGRQEGRQEGKQEGRQEGKQEGRQEGKQEIFSQLLTLGLITKKDIEKLQKKP